MRTLVPIVLTLAVLGGCSRLWLDTYWRSERYVLLAIDTRAQMHLAFDGTDGTAIGLVGPTVYAVGSDQRHIVVKRHPASDASGSFDRTQTEYFVVERTMSPDFASRREGVSGPLSRPEFERLSVERLLPGFTKTFRDFE